MRSRNTSESVQITHLYIRLHLDIEQIDDLTRARLEQAGVACVQDGGAFRAYGIVDDGFDVQAVIEAQPHVKAVEFAAPPVGF